MKEKYYKALKSKFDHSMDGVHIRILVTSDFDPFEYNFSPVIWFFDVACSCLSVSKFFLYSFSSISMSFCALHTCPVNGT